MIEVYRIHIGSYNSNTTYSI